MKNTKIKILLLAACSLLFAPSAHAADVLAHWSFDELAQDGHAFPDLHGPYRALISDTSSASLDNGKDTPFGKAVSLGPGGSGLSIPALPPAFYDKSFTVAAWVKLADNKEPNYLLSDWQKTNAYFFGFEKGKITAALRNDKPNSKNTANNQDIISNKPLTTAISPNTWHHVAWVWEKTGPKNASLTIYLDGNKTAETKSTGKVGANILANARPASIGFKADTKTAFHGSIDELWVFNDALSAEQVANLMKSNNINSSEMLANAGPAAAAPAPAATPTTPAPAPTPPPANNTPAANTTPTSPTTPTTPTTPAAAASSKPPADNGPITFTSGNNNPTPAAPASANPTPTAPTAASNNPPAVPTPTKSAAAPAPSFSAPNFSVKSGPTSDTSPPASDTPKEVATITPHYTPARIAGIIASGITSLSLSAFLFWASTERSKMKSSRR